MKMKRYVVLTTAHRGVFFGEVVEYDLTNKIAKLVNARMVIYWSVQTRGVLGLAAIGPQKGSKVTPFIPAIELTDVVSVMDCTPVAVAVWMEEEIW